MADAGNGGAAASIDDGVAGGQGQVDAGAVGYRVWFVEEGAVEERWVLGRFCLGGGGLEAVRGNGGVGIER